MERKKRMLCEKPSFEICLVEPDGSERTEIYSLKEFSNQLPTSSMNRRGFLNLSFFAGVTAFAVGATSKAYGAEEAVKFATIPRERVRVSTGEIVKLDVSNNIICIKERPDSEEICINVTPETEIEVEGRKKVLSQLRVGEIITVRYTVSFTGERRAISMTSPVTVSAYPKPEPKPTRAPSYPSSCGARRTYCS